MRSGMDERPVYYVNNFINWEEYNRHYHPDFERIEKSLANEWEKVLQQSVETE